MFFLPPEHPIDNAELTEALRAFPPDTGPPTIVSAQVVGYNPEARIYQVSVVYQHPETSIRIAVTHNFTAALIHRLCGLPVEEADKRAEQGLS